MKRSKHFYCIYALYIVATTFYLINLLGDYQYFTKSFLFLTGFAISFYWIGYIMVDDLTSSNIISLRFLFNVFGLLYSNNFLIEIIETDMRLDDYTGTSMLMSHLALISFNIFYSNTRRKQISRLSGRRELDVNKFSYGLLFLLLLCIAAEYYIVVRQIGLMNYILATRADRTLMRADYSLLTFYKHTIPMISAISFYLFLQYKKRLSLFIFAISFLLAVAHSLISVSRTEFLATLLPIAYLLNRHKILSNKMLIILGVGGFFLMAVWKSLLQSDSGNLVMQQDTELNSWYEICRNIMKRENGTPFIYGKSYFTTLLNLVIPVTGIETLSTWYLRIYEPDTLAMGGGRGFSSVFEAYMNFGILGIIGVYGLYGYLAKKINTNSELGLFIFLIIIVSIHQLFRSEAYSFWKNMMWFRMYPMLILYFISAKRRKIIK